MSLIQFLTSLLSGKKEPQTDHTDDFKLKMSEETFNFMTSTESESMKQQLRDEMIYFERQGIFRYTIYSDKWEYYISNGMFRASPIAPKGA